MSAHRNRHSKVSFPSSLPAQLSRRLKAAVETLSLSDRQQRIALLVAEGKSDKEIGAAIGISRNTVKTYMQRIFHRLGISDRRMLTAMVYARCLDGQAECRHHQGE